MDLSDNLNVSPIILRLFLLFFCTVISGKSLLFFLMSFHAMVELKKNGFTLFQLFQSMILFGILNNESTICIIFYNILDGNLFM